MAWTEADIRYFLERYGQALGAGDLSAIVGAWDVPALVLSDEGARAVNAPQEIEQFFRAAVEWYHAQGMVTARPSDIRIDALGQRILSVDVRWSAIDVKGAVSTERSRYILSMDEDGPLHIRVAISVTA